MKLAELDSMLRLHSERLLATGNGPDRRDVYKMLAFELDITMHEAKHYTRKFMEELSPETSHDHPFRKGQRVTLLDKKCDNTVDHAIIVALLPHGRLYLKPDHGDHGTYDHVFVEAL